MHALHLPPRHLWRMGLLALALTIVLFVRRRAGRAGHRGPVHAVGHHRRHRRELRRRPRPVRAGVGDGPAGPPSLLRGR